MRRDSSQPMLTKPNLGAVGSLPSKSAWFGQRRGTRKTLQDPRASDDSDLNLELSCDANETVAYLRPLVHCSSWGQRRCVAVWWLG